MEFIISFICFVAALGMSFRFFNFRSEADFLKGFSVGAATFLIDFVILLVLSAI